MSSDAAARNAITGLNEGSSAIGVAQNQGGEGTKRKR